MERMNLTRMEGDPMILQEVEIPCPEVAENRFNAGRQSGVFGTLRCRKGKWSPSATY